MGCWYESCMLTHLPIHSGERAYAVVLMEHPLYNNSCYVCSRYTPLYLFEGKYDDYGGLEDLSMDDHEMFKELVGMLQCNNEIYELSGFSSEGVLIETKKSPMFSLGAKFRKECRLALVFLKAPIVDKLTEKLPVWYKNNERKVFEEMLHASAEDLEFKKMAVCRELSNHPLNLIATDWYKHTLLQRTDRYRKLLRINYVLDRLRMDWFVPSGKGSQEYVTEMHSEYVEALRNEINRLNQRVEM